MMKILQFALSSVHPETHVISIVVTPAQAGAQGIQQVTG
jgi:hypothetical protein